MKVYLSGALQASRNLTDARHLYEVAAAMIVSAGHSAYLPHQQTDPELAPRLSSDAVFERDLKQLKSADAIVAFLNEPSFGVGAEIALAGQSNVPILALHRRDGAVSRFLLGYLASVGGVVRSYRTNHDLATAITGFVTDPPSAQQQAARRHSSVAEVSSRLAR
jgi:Nucleoside 2-deoxyribosyltransferase